MNINSNGIMASTGSTSATIVLAGEYTFQARSTFNAPSGCTLTIAQSGSASNSYTQGPPSTIQTHLEIEQYFMCAAGDVLTFTVSSSSIDDKYGLSLLKTNYSLYQDS